MVTVTRREYDTFMQGVSPTAMNKVIEGHRVSAIQWFGNDGEVIASALYTKYAPSTPVVAEYHINKNVN